ncbi:Piso0_002290 [Millerozyma farinosa CBS 7064]|uniref:Dynein heavy chain, cytoplasmic n=1 Tax=Pichia sorbitophila (strain ATCC MYA-4447 / BCRC 22081 / CBS 7064 / NBRC 10061 / NRRL Y-12695) TaxID=559304 RepID=G8YC79_PICSO|nr:Piso0_002290 [Millerozyma farinosa CBS 7064]
MVVTTERLVVFVEQWTGTSASGRAVEQIKHFASGYGRNALYIISKEDEFDAAADVGDIRGIEDARMVGVMVKPPGLVEEIENLNLVRLAMGASPNDTFESIRSIVQYGLGSWFGAIAGESSSETTVSRARIKFNELSLTLQHLQQQIEVPDLMISVHPKVISYLAGSETEVRLLEETGFLNELTSIVGTWVRQIQRITSLHHDPADGDSIIDEVQFWKSMEIALADLERQISSPEVRTSIEFLNKAKRFHISLTFQNDTDFTKRIAEARLYNSFLRDFPIEQLHTEINDLDTTALESIISNLFGHFRKLRNISSFPLTRSIQIAEILLQDIARVLARRLTHINLMSLPFPQYISTFNDSILRSFDIIEDQVKSITNLFREVLRKRQEKFFIIKIQQDAINELKKRAYITYNFRLKHQNMLSILVNLQEQTDHASMLINAYNNYILSCDIFDMGPQTMNAWATNEALYQSVFVEVESATATKLNNLFELCNNFNDYVSLFDKLNLYESDTVSFLDLINDDYKLRILTAADNEVNKLIQFNLSQSSEIANAIADLQSEGPIVSRYLWNVNLLKKLEYFKEEMPKMLGQNWNNYSIGKRLDGKINKVLETSVPSIIFEKWLVEFKDIDLTLSLPVAKIITQPNYDITVNFDSQLIEFSRQVVRFDYLGLRPPSHILVASKKIEKVKPFVTGLYEHMNLFKELLDNSLNETDHGGNVTVLLRNRLTSLLEIIPSLLETRWDHLIQAIDLQDASVANGVMISQNLVELRSLNLFNKFQSDTYSLYSDLNRLYHYHESIYHQHMEELNECDFRQENISKILSEIQNEVSNIALENFSNIDKFCDIVNSDLKAVLSRKLKFELNQFSQMIKSKNENSNIDGVQIHKLELYQGQTIVCTPPLLESKRYFYSLVSNECQVIQGQQPIQFYENRKDMKITYDFLDPSVNNALCDTLNEIDNLITTGETYLNKWHILQNIWKLDLDNDSDWELLFPSEPEISDWANVIDRYFELRQILDLENRIISLNGVLIIDFSKIYNRVTLFTQHYEEKLSTKFASYVQTQTRSFIREMDDSKKLLEPALDFSGEPNSILVELKNYFDIKDKLCLWYDKISAIAVCPSLFAKLSFKYPKEWIYREQLESKLANLQSLVDVKSKNLDKNLEFAKSRIKSFSSDLKASIDLLVDEWSKFRPVSSTIRALEAIGILNKFETRLEDISNQRRLIIHVSDNLQIPFEDDSKYSFILEEIADLREVWTTLNDLSDNLTKINSFKWIDLQTHSLHQKLSELLMVARTLPPKVRRFSAFDELVNKIKQYLQNIAFISELKNSSLKERHWKLIRQNLNLDPMPYDSLTLSNIWELNFSLNSQFLRNIMTQASNEKIIDDTLRQIENNWASTTFETFSYRNKSLLVKNWGTLFDQCNSDLNALESMRNSAFYSTFENQIIEKQEKLTRLSILFDVWIEVQRQWAYLDSIFDENNKDLLRMLPVEASRFSSLSTELNNILKRAYNYKNVTGVLGIPYLHEFMENSLQSLNRTRRSLSEYLENERLTFPRFYFIGNEDLLDLIGSGTDIIRINKHIGKMFQNISHLGYDTENRELISLNDYNGESMKLNNPISLPEKQSISDALLELDMEIKNTLADLITANLNTSSAFYQHSASEEHLFKFIAELPSQVVTLCFQITFTKRTESAIADNTIPQLYSLCEHLVTKVSHFVSMDISNAVRLKLENLIIELINERETLQAILNTDSTEEIGFIWSIQQRFYFKHQEKDFLKCIEVKQAHTQFIYGFEYLGITEKLAYTPLVKKSFLSMSLAHFMKLGGALFGPAGTGKTEAIKALGRSLGINVIVFCCDESFDFQSLSRILIGLCKLGCWGCFDEFNRLDEKLLSAVSTQIENIKSGINSQKKSTELLGKSIKPDDNTGIFVTMNPGYVGRSELPENLKKLFFSFSMCKPDLSVIVEVLLASQGFIHSKYISTLIHPFFKELSERTSDMLHYDFGLRTLKTILLRCGRLLRSKNNIEEEDLKKFELQVLLRSLSEIIIPKLIKEDEQIFQELKEKYVPDLSFSSDELAPFKHSIEQHCLENGFVLNDNWIKKTLQVIEVSNSNNGIMLVGESGTGKTCIRNTALRALSEIQAKDSTSYVIDSKVLSKDTLFGRLDTITREWTDGIFTKIVRQVQENIKGELSKIIWVFFDGDIDPEWAETLNSVLDDNKLLTLPSGERLSLPSNLKLVFEIDSLKHATPATVTRCGMVWFDREVVTVQQMAKKCLFDLMNKPIQIDNANVDGQRVLLEYSHRSKSFMDTFIENDIQAATQYALKYARITDFSGERASKTLFTMLNSYRSKLYKFCHKNESNVVNIDSFVAKAVYLSTVWSFAGDCAADSRHNFGKDILRLPSFDNLKDQLGSFGEELRYFDCDISLPSAEWLSWISKVSYKDLEPQDVTKPSTVVPTADTLRNEDVIFSIINQHKSLILCGPPGSGKTMCLLDALRRSPNLDFISLNFSKETSPSALIASLFQHCKVSKTSGGKIVHPRDADKWVVVFCDEINLPKPDTYGTQRVISLMRQMIEYNGFWDDKEKHWVELAKIQFVGACNPDTDPGRNELSKRFTHLLPVIMIDYPEEISLRQIYQIFIDATLKLCPNLKGFSIALTNSMIKIYFESKNKLSGLHPHYVYSPRELTRWCKGLVECLHEKQYDRLEELLRSWLHEGLRLFYDRLVKEEEKTWTKSLFKSVLETNFSQAHLTSVFEEPLFYTNWLTSRYEYVCSTDLFAFLSERLKVFCDEETEVQLILYEDLIDISLRIDRVLRQPQGHMIIVGPPTSGRYTLAKFVSWINGIKVVSLNVSGKYSLDDFDSQLRTLLLRCVKGEKICFLVDESSLLDVSFIERMNTLLANSEVPGLFEGDELKEFLGICKNEAESQGYILETKLDLFNWFTSQLSSNLHVIFTLSELTNVNSPNLISSPALFNRCVLSWIDDWSDGTLHELVHKSLKEVAFDESSYTPPENLTNLEKPYSLRKVLVEIFTSIHSFKMEYESPIRVSNFPVKILELVDVFVRIYSSKESELEDDQRRLSNGLDKLRDCVLQVNSLKKVLSEKRDVLAAKDIEARQMLDEMLVNQNEAERRQEFSISTQQELTKQESEIEERRTKVMKDLEDAEPAVIDAQKGVQDIKKQHLTEIRSMSNPPSVLKLVMESVCTLLGYKVTNWRDVQLIIRRDDFISSIVNFDNESSMTEDLENFMCTQYLSRDDYNFESANRASKACGPLLQWVKAQLTYAEVLQKVGPLRQEVRTLENQIRITKAQLIAVHEMILELETKIEEYKVKYSSLIRETENIKMEMERVENKVNRSTKLIEDLTSEKDRWKASISRFNTRRKLLIGNSIMSAAFLIYAAKEDQKGRLLFMEHLRTLLDDFKVLYESNLSIPRYLIPYDEIHKWEKIDVLKDELSIQNFTILKYSRIPLLIDPSGNSLHQILDIFSPRKVCVSSFLNESLPKQLENEIRFGGIIVIKDAEFLDPRVNPILRNEISHTGGRRTIEINGKVVDISADFRMILYSRDAHLTLSSFVLARTSIINFAITKGSIETMILDSTLKELEPDIDIKRNSQMTLHNEYIMQLHSLEEELLSCLNSTTGAILDDDTVLKTLASIKSESKRIDSQVDESEGIMDAVNKSRSNYMVYARHATALFSIIERLSFLDTYYQCDLEVFFSIYSFALKNTKSHNQISNFLNQLYREAYARISPSLSNLHKITVALSLCFAYYASDSRIFSEVLHSLLKAIADRNIGEILLQILQTVDPESSYSWEDISEHTVNEVCSKVQDSSQSALSDILNAIVSAGQNADSILNSFTKITSFLFSGVGPFSSMYDLKDWALHQIGKSSPIIMTSPTDYDPSFRVDVLARVSKTKLISISMGSKEGIESANTALDNLHDNGPLVLLQNVHLSPSWLSYLSKKLETIPKSSLTRIFLTTSFKAQLPVALIANSNLLRFENIPSLKGVMNESFEATVSTFKEESNIRLHMYFLLSWFHSLLSERMRYFPVSFREKYDISEFDLMVGHEHIKRIFDRIEYERTYVTPDIIPWKEVRYLIAEITYGGKIDAMVDFEYVNHLALLIFRPESFDSSFNLILNEVTESTGEILFIPEGLSLDAYKKWIKELPEEAPPSWLSLQNQDVNEFYVRQGKEIIEQVKYISCI